MLRRALISALLSIFALAGAGCSPDLMEEKARAAAEKAQDALVALDHDALQQKVSPEVVKSVQEQLQALHQYMGPINGKLDQVTLNAYEAFQRQQGVAPDGHFDEATLQALAEAARAARS